MRPSARLDAPSWPHRLARALGVAALVSASWGCGHPPPASQMPSAQAAIDRMRATQACGNGIQAAAKIDHFGEGGRVRGDLLLFAVKPARLRMDVVSPFGVTLATLASDGKRFSLSDLRDKRFFIGPAEACNIARLTTVPIPGHVLVGLLRGEAPVLKNGGDADKTIEWSRRGYYVVRVRGTRDAEQEVHLAPHPDDFGKPWSEQRLRVKDVLVKQQGVVLYHAELSDHRAAKMAAERVDPDGIDPPVPPSGPMCEAELPRKLHVEVPGKDEDVQFRYDTVTWNPPIIEGLWTQPVPGGVQVVRVDCE
ncbi:MAG: hypothetical protein KC657_03210 [Myxococcales bacterium]|nr:hypothetical protein [Myxococcales bacterium]